VGAFTGKSSNNTAQLSELAPMGNSQPQDMESIWPKDSAKADPERLLKETEQIMGIRAHFDAAKRVLSAPADATAVADMPEAVLDGRLGEICFRCMKRFPVAYAWPALVTVASALTPRSAENMTKGVRFNLYTALVGPCHSGKSQAISAAQNLLDIEPPTLMELMAGSAEGLIRKFNDAAGNPRLFSPDELGHLLEKAQIQHASFAYVLNAAFYRDQFEVLMARGAAATFHASLSILGGLVDEKFQDLFSTATIGGLHDRFIFGQCPTGFSYEYEPFQSVREPMNPVEVSIDPEVWARKADWRSGDPELEPRICELAIRVAAICASYDGRAVLTAEALGPARAFADYQKRIRRLLKPNAGECLEGKVALKILDYLDRQGGRFVSRRTMLRDINANRFGPSVADRALDVLHANGEIEITKGRPVLVRRCLDDELELLNGQQAS